MQKIIVTIIGARPQFIKSFPVSTAIRLDGHFREVIIHTGQHFDFNMSEIFFRELGLKAPEYNLNIHGGTHGAQTGKMLVKIEEILKLLQPELVLLYGDTDSTLSGALAAAKLHIPVAHVEAGLRSFDMKMPEEINRVLTDKVSTLLLCPTDTAVKNLLEESFDPKKILFVGDVMYDMAKLFLEKIPSNPVANSEQSEYVLTTFHRAENTDNPLRLKVIVECLINLSSRMKIIFPLHPRTKKALIKSDLLDSLSDSVDVIDPVNYSSMLFLEKNASLIITDSGGVQKEAFFCKVPCVILRENSEWVELLASGWSRLAPPFDPKKVFEIVEAALGSSGASLHAFGDGNASQKIVQALKEIQCQKK